MDKITEMTPEQLIAVASAPYVSDTRGLLSSILAADLAQAKLLIEIRDAVKARGPWSGI